MKPLVKVKTLEIFQIQLFYLLEGKNKVHWLGSG